LGTTDDERRSNDGVKALGFVLALFAVAQVGRVLCDYWLGFWSNVEQARQDDKYLDDDGLGGAVSHSQQRDSTFFIWVYSLITWVTSLLVAARSYGFTTLAVRASANLHRMLIKRVLRAPINTYFDVTPTGRILNRFVVAASEELAPL
jgi:ABC-type multidrug transport system fused ATPase/permease subunit